MLDKPNGAVLGLGLALVGLVGWNLAMTVQLLGDVQSIHENRFTYKDWERGRQEILDRLPPTWLIERIDKNLLLIELHQEHHLDEVKVHEKRKHSQTDKK
jgi:hypothetical protein